MTGASDPGGFTKEHSYFLLLTLEGKILHLKKNILQHSVQSTNAYFHYITLMPSVFQEPAFSSHVFLFLLSQRSSLGLQERPPSLPSPSKQTQNAIYPVCHSAADVIHTNVTQNNTHFHML